MDAVDPGMIDSAEQALRTVAGVVDVRRVWMRWIGHGVHVDAELDSDAGTSLAAHRVAHDAKHELTHAVPRLTAAVVHTYPADGDAR
jgi:divalent metal cation (Fe/Co/Zn/Cd) transporter